MKFDRSRITGLIQLKKKKEERRFVHTDQLGCITLKKEKELNFGSDLNGPNEFRGFYGLYKTMTKLTLVKNTIIIL